MIYISHLLEGIRISGIQDMLRLPSCTLVAHTTVAITTFIILHSTPVYTISMPENTPSLPPIPDDIPLAGLISIAHRMYSIFIDTQTIAPGLTTGQIPFVMQISQNPGITQDELASHNIFDKGTVARAVRKLEENGYLSRTPDPDNRRKLRLSLTAEGEAVVPRVFAADREWEDAVLSGLSETEHRTMYTYCLRMAEQSRNLARTGTGNPEQNDTEIH